MLQERLLILLLYEKVIEFWTNVWKVLTIFFLCYSESNKWIIGIGYNGYINRRRQDTPLGPLVPTLGELFVHGANPSEKNERC